MSDQVKTTDQVKEGEKSGNRLEKAPDAQSVRNASGEEKDRALNSNPNRTRGVTELAYKDGFIDDPNKRSVELVAFDKDGNEIHIDKTSKTRQKDICLDPHPTRIMPAITAEAEAKIRAEKEVANRPVANNDAEKQATANTGTLKAIAENASLPPEKRLLAEQYQDMRTASESLGINTEVIDNLASEVLAPELAELKDSETVLHQPSALEPENDSIPDLYGDGAALIAQVDRRGTDGRSLSESKLTAWAGYCWRGQRMVME